MIVALWIVNGLLAVAFLLAGSLKVIRTRPQLQAAGLAWVEDFADPTVKAIGAVEIMGAVGLILPLLTGIAPILTPLAACGLFVTMALAVVVHVRRRENPAPSVVLGLLSAASAVLGFLVVAG